MRSNVEVASAGPELVGVPASPAQESLWIADQVDEAGSPNDGIILRLTGRLDIHALRTSFVEIVRRHAVLRTTLRLVDGALIQRISDGADIDFAVPTETADGARDASSTRNLDRVVAAASAELSRPFLLASEAPIRVRLYRLDAADHLMLVALHHVASDHHSMGILLDELMALYGAFRNGTDPALAPPAAQYADWARVQAEQLTGDRLASLVRRRVDALRGVDPSVNLPAAGPAASGRRSVNVERRIPPATADQMRSVARQLGVSVFAFASSVVRIALWRLVDQRDILLAAPFTQRLTAEWESVIGPFISLVGLRNPIDDSHTVADLAVQEQRAVRHGLEHCVLPHDTVRRLAGPRVRADIPERLEVLFSYDGADAPTPQLPGLTCTQIQPDSFRAHLRLDGKLMDGSDGSMRMWWSAPVADGATWLADLADGFLAILEVAVRAPRIRLDDVPAPFTGAVAGATGVEASAAPPVPPATATERHVAAMWADLLEVDDIEDTAVSIFRLGAHSLTVAQLAASLRDEFDVAVTAADIYAKPTIMEQARLLDGLFLREMGGGL